MSVSTSKKIGRNDKCICESGKKYKNCCMVALESRINYSDGQSTHTPAIEEIMGSLSSEFPKLQFIDITNTLTNQTYRPYQLSNYRKPIVMIAERTATNEDVFSTRINIPSSNIILMYHGAYRTFPTTLYRSMITSIHMFLKCNNENDDTLLNY